MGEPARRIWSPNLEIERPRLYVPGRRPSVRPLRIYAPPAPVTSLWAHVQDSPGANGVASATAASLNVGAFGSAVTLNDFVVVWSWGGGSTAPVAANLTCSDNGATPNTYNRLIFKDLTLGSLNPYAVIFAAKITSNPSSGNLNPKVSNAATGSFIVCCASEFSGGSLTADGTSSNSNTNNLSNAPTCGNMTTTVANDLLLACLGFEQGPDLTGMTDPTNYTSTGRTLSETLEAGSGVWRIVSGTVTNNNPAWTLTGASSNGTDGWAAAQAALQPAVSGDTEEEMMQSRIMTSIP